MRKLLFIISCFFIPILFFPQMMEDFEKEKQFIIETTKNKEEQFSTTKLWIADKFTDSFKITFAISQGFFKPSQASPIENFSGYKIIEENKDLGIIIIEVNKLKFRTITETKVGSVYWALDLRCKIEIKDNKSRITFSNIKIWEFETNYRNELLQALTVEKYKIKSEFKEDFDKLFINLSNNLKDTIEKGSNW